MRNEPKGYYRNYEKSRDYKPTPQVEEEKLGLETIYGVVANANKVRVRSTPSLGSDDNVIGIVSRGEHFGIVRELPNFYEIAYKVGVPAAYISSDFFEKEE